MKNSFVFPKSLKGEDRIMIFEKMVKMRCLFLLFLSFG